MHVLILKRDTDRKRSESPPTPMAEFPRFEEDSCQELLVSVTRLSVNPVCDELRWSCML